MSLIKRWWRSLFHFHFFNSKFGKVMKLYKKEVVDHFDLADLNGSFWVDCNETYTSPPKKLEDYEEFRGPAEQQAQIIIKNWRYFSASAHKDLLGVLKYTVSLRRNVITRTPSDIRQERVSDHVYEM